MASALTLEDLLRRDRWVVMTGLAVICLISWIYILSGAGTGVSASSMSALGFPPKTIMTSGENIPAGWSLDYLFTMLAMWWVMMIAMMTPSAAPMILLYARVFRSGQKNDQFPAGSVPVWAFTGGYLVSWFAFSLAATGLQWLLERAGHIHPIMMWSTSAALSGAFFPGRRCLSIVTTEVRMSETLPLSQLIFCPGIGAKAGPVLCAWVWIMACIASVAAGS